jgi:two-component system cell cycle response regulator PopA
MRVTIRAADARRAREIQDILAEAGVQAPALQTPDAAPNEAEPVDVIVFDCRAPSASLSAFARKPGTAACGLASALAPPPVGLDLDCLAPLDLGPELLLRDLQEAHRSALAAEELCRRRATADRFTIEQMGALVVAEPRTLYVGEPHPMFLALQAAHVARGAAIDAAFTTFSGFDSLHDVKFDAVVLNAARDPNMALSLCGALRRNARLHNVPTALLVKPGDRTTIDAAIERGASVWASSETPPSALVGWLFERIEAARRRAAVEDELDWLRRRLGGPNGLLPLDRFTVHLEAMAADAHAALRPLSVAVLKIERGPGAGGAAWEDSAAAVEELAGRLVRSYDISALIGPGTVVIAFSNAHEAAARTSADRIVAVAECTSFAAPGSPQSALIRHAVAELAPGESATGLLARALDPFPTDLRRLMI